MSGESTPVLSPGTRSIAVVRALQLGDMLCAVPALRSLRAACPHARITLVGLPWARDLAARFSAYVDDFEPFPGFPGLPEHSCDVGAVPGFLERMQQAQFDVTLQLHGSGRLMNPVTLLFGARVTAGFHPPGEVPPAGGHFLEWQAREHEILRFTRLLEALGAPAAGADLEFPVSSAELEDCRRLERELGLEPGGYACIHAGSQLPSRRWPAERFAAVADALASEGLDVVLTGTAGEASIVSRVGAAMRQPALDVTGRTSLGVLAELVRGARLVVCNDTGISHIAAAMHTPSVVVSCGADTERWSPLERARHRVLFHPIACRPCGHVSCPIGHPCAEAVHVDDVLAEARSLLFATDRSLLEALACVP